MALGEVLEGYPMWEELLQLVLTNRVRQDPAKAKKDYNDPNAPKNLTWKTKDYAPCLPMLYHQLVSKASRAHSQDMLEQNYFDHTGKDGSSPGDRIKRYFTGYASWGENIAKGQKNAEAVTVAWLNSDGHRENIFKCSWTHMGMGMVPATTKHWTQNFIVLKGTFERPLVHTGVHFPQSVGENQDLNFFANYYDSQGKAPQEAKVVINGKCYDMKVEYGSESNGNYKAVVQLPKGCASYYFKFRGSDGTSGLYPSRGSYQVSVGSASCNDFYVAKQEPSSCDAPCSSNTECASHQECLDKKCVDTGRCKVSSDCGEGYTCKDQKCQPEGKIGNGCESDSDCAKPMSCTATQGGKKICTTTCSASQACPPGYQCLTEANASYCAPSQSCKTDTDCSGFYTCTEGKCVERNKCTKHTDCEKGTLCDNGICKTTGSQGVTCAGSTQCDKGSECIPWETGKPSTCGMPCKTQDDCPVDTTCKSFSSDSLYCFGKPEPPVKPQPTTKPPETGTGCHIVTNHNHHSDLLWWCFALGFLLLVRRRQS